LSIEVSNIFVFGGQVFPVLIILPVSLGFKESEPATFTESVTGVSCAIITWKSNKENGSKIIFME